MALTSFTKTLLRVGVGVGVVGGGAGLLVARHLRQEGAERDYRSTPMTIDQFVDRTITAYDRGTYPSPFEPFDSYADAVRTPDGKLNIGVEEQLGDDRQYFPELVSFERDEYRRQVISGHEFIRGADEDKDGVVTRDELIAAVTPHAGDDGKLDETERRRVLTEAKLAVVHEERDLDSVAGWRSDTMTTAHDAAMMAMRGLPLRDTKLVDDGSPAVRISDIAPWIPWRDGRVITGPITSQQPSMAKVDDAGNGDGLLSVREVADWIDDHHGAGSLLPGHLVNDRAAFEKVLEPQQIARVESDTLGGHVYYSDDIPQRDVDRFFGGSIPDHVDEVPKFRTFRGDAQWEPDPKD